jgi:hypothetical protein
MKTGGDSLNIMYVISKSLEGDIIIWAVTIVLSVFPHIANNNYDYDESKESYNWWSNYSLYFVLLLEH